MHAHSPVAPSQTPWPEQPPGHDRASHAAPRQPASHAQTPAAPQTPWPEQLEAHVGHTSATGGQSSAPSKPSMPPTATSSGLTSLFNDLGGDETLSEVKPKRPKL